MKRELDHLARFLHMAVDYKKKLGFKGVFYIEPKPKEPTKHQYDSDAASCLNFLREYDLLDHFKLNVEVNHAWLAGKSMEHELEVAGAAGALGSIDANMGDYFIGWDTDQFPDGPVPHRQDDADDPEVRRAHHGRRELRRQGPARELHGRRPLLRAHCRHGRVRARPEDRREGAATAASRTS